MDFKRINIISGHYGSGKTNIAVNLAFDLKAKQEKVALADIDIVNPYFRSKDSEELLNNAGIRLICSEYANTNVDIPALPKELYSILDVGGDERGALALGRITDSIKDEDNYQMLYVVNFYRPLTKDADSAIAVMREIEDACRLKFTAIIHNSNLGRETTYEDILYCMPKLKELSEKTGLKVIYNTVDESLFSSLEEKVDNLYSLTMQKKI